MLEDGVDGSEVLGNGNEVFGDGHLDTLQEGVSGKARAMFFSPLFQGTK